MNCEDPCNKTVCHSNSYCYRGLGGKAKCICDRDFGEDGDGKCIRMNGKPGKNSTAFHFFPCFFLCGECVVSGILCLRCYVLHATCYMTCILGYILLDTCYKSRIMCYVFHVRYWY